MDLFRSNPREFRVKSPTPYRDLNSPPPARPSCNKVLLDEDARGGMSPEAAKQQERVLPEQAPPPPPNADENTTKTTALKKYKNREHSSARGDCRLRPIQGCLLRGLGGSPHSFGGLSTCLGQPTFNPS